MTFQTLTSVASMFTINIFLLLISILSASHAMTCGHFVHAIIVLFILVHLQTRNGLVKIVECIEENLGTHLVDVDV